jgi:hypothetical protein
VLSATRARSLFDRVATVGVLAGLSLPTFVLGQLLLWGVFLPLNKPGYTWIQDGYVSPAEHPRGHRLHPARPPGPAQLTGAACLKGAVQFSDEGVKLFGGAGPAGLLRREPVGPLADLLDSVVHLVSS